MELSKKKYLDVSKDSNQKNTPFRKGHLPYQDRPQGGGWYYYTAKSSNQNQNKNVWFQNNASVSARKFHHAGQHQMVSISFTIQKEVPVTSNSELVPLIKIETLEHVYIQQ